MPDAIKADHSGVAGEPEATTKEASESPGEPSGTRGHDGAPVNPAPAFLAGGTPVSDEAVEAAEVAMSREFRRYTGTKVGEAMWNIDMERTWELVARSAVEAVAPLLAAQALRQAAAEIRSHISAPRARVAADVPLDVAAGIVERRADELERGTDHG